MPGVPPVPIPNTAVKPRAANGSWTIGSARVGCCQVYAPVLRKKDRGSLFYGSDPSVGELSDPRTTRYPSIPCRARFDRFRQARAGQRYSVDFDERRPGRSTWRVSSGSSESVVREKIADAEVQPVRDTKQAHNGADGSTPPITVFQSRIDAEKLAQMIRIRALSFRREINHVFGDLPVTNPIINALQRKRAAKMR
jgi:hypothetical protein